MKTASRKHLARWTGWFFITNIGLLLLLGLSYLPFIPSFQVGVYATLKGHIVTWIFAVFAFVGQFSLVALLGGLLTLPIALFIPKKGVVFVWGAFIASFILWILVADALLYHLYRIHMGGLIWHIVTSGVLSQVVELSATEYVTGLVILAVLFLVELGLAIFIWHRIDFKKSVKNLYWTMLCLAVVLFISYTMFTRAGLDLTKITKTQESNNHLIIMTAQIVPYYETVLGFVMPKQPGGSQLNQLDYGFYVQTAQKNKPLRYPLHPLKCKSPKEPLNIVLIGIDTWRADMLNKTVAPHMTQFANDALQFTNHYSGGNATRPGIFTLFYSIPPSYWTAVKDQNRSPVFIDQLLREQYQVGVFASASITFPDFQDTVFSALLNVPIDTPGDNSQQRDKYITQEFRKFILNRNKQKPFFSFLFYDAVHGYCEGDTTYPKPFQPAVTSCDRVALTKTTDPTPYLNRYKNAVLFDDTLIGKDLDLLRKQGLLKNTIVIITADHGEEFNDEKQGYWGHASAYDPAQLHVPFVVYWPGKKPQEINYRTSHYELVPTLMKKILLCKSSANDYSVGSSLFAKSKKPFMIAGSYVDYAIIQNNRITTIYPDGNYSITYDNLTSIPGAELNLKVLKAVFKELNQFFK